MVGSSLGDELGDEVGEDDDAGVTARVAAFTATPVVASAATPRAVTAMTMILFMLRRYEPAVEERARADPRNVQDRGDPGIAPQNGDMRILIVEDDPAVAAGIADGLGAAAIDVDAVATGQAALDALSEAHDLVVLDLGLPDMDGTDVARSIRATSAVPIIVVSARGDEMDRVLALELGADDYLVKPFGMRELLARIRAVTRRTAVEPAESAPDLGRLSIDARSRRVMLGDAEVHLTPTEFDLLDYLAAEPGAVHPAQRHPARCVAHRVVRRDQDPRRTRRGDPSQAGRPRLDRVGPRRRLPVRDRAVSLRLVAAMIAVVLLALLVQDIPLAGYLRDVERERIVTALERDAFVLAGRSEEDLHETAPDADGSITALAQAYRDSSGARVVIVDRTGTAIVTSDEDGAGVGDSFLTRPEIAEALGGGVTSGTRFSQTLGIDLLYVAVPVLSGDDIFGAVRLTYPNRVVDDAVTAKLAGLGIVALTTVLLAALIGWVFSRSVTRPIRLLRAANDGFAAGDRGVRADPDAGPPEVRSLARSFNGMASRIDALLEQQRGFAADASHQLRTPLTALRLRLERARELAPTDPSAAVDRLEAADAELDRLETLIEGLLVLSRAEGSGVVAVPVDLAAVAAARVEQWSALAAETGATVDYAGPPTSPVLAVPGAVEQIVDNLVDNALGVGSPTVTVRVDAAALHVLDRGPGLTAEDRAHAFERFWRGRGSQDRRGSGLGLAIVAQLATASGAVARLDAREGGGLDAVVVFRQGRTSSSSTPTN